MSIETRWCYVCKNHSKEIPNELKEVYNLLSKEYRHIVYCKKFNTLFVANDTMWIDKARECQFFEG